MELELLNFDKAIPAAVVANDDMYRQGDQGEKAMAGLNIWLPKTVLTTTSTATLFGQDRSVNPARLQGSRYQLSANENVGAGVRLLCAEIAGITKTAGPDLALTHPLTANYVASQLDNGIRYAGSDGKGPASGVLTNVGKPQFMKLNGKPVDILTTPSADPNVIWLLNRNNIGVYYYGSAQNNKFVDFSYGPDGSMFKVSHDETGIEIRTSSYGEFVINYPGTCGRIDLHSSNVRNFGM